VAADDRRRDDAVRPGAHELRLGLLLDRARDDVQIGREAARREHDVDVVGVVRQARGEGAGALDAGLAQRLFERGVADEDGRAVLRQRGHSLRVALDDDERLARAPQLAYDARADAARAADDHVFGESVHLAPAASPPEGLVKLGLDEALDRGREQQADGRD
jgi:hypothetical protein